jgi:hypothetical protein
MRGALRMATLKKARQKAVEAQTQKISKMTRALNAIFIVICINYQHEQPANPTRMLSEFS